jgi:hypothetical protein
MSVPSFSRVEIPTTTAEDLASASRALADLSAELRRIANSVTDNRLMRLAAHDAIRNTSSQLRGSK